jgi:hypothetical protein
MQELMSVEQRRQDDREKHILNNDIERIRENQRAPENPKETNS